MRKNYYYYDFISSNIGCCALVVSDTGVVISSTPEKKLEDSLMKINELSTLTYHEEICFPNFLGKNKGYSLEGAHHLTFVEWNGDWIVATDGINRNFYRVY